MIKLSSRLNTIAEEIEMGETMADIGTDHGFLPVFLWEKGICPKVVMTDVSSGSLAKARLNCQTIHPEADFDLRLGNGLEVLEPGEVDAVVIAGMGGILMTEILGADIEKAWSFKKIILQPRNRIGQLRFWLYDNCFSIINEKLVREGKFICEVLTAVPKEVAITRDLSADDIEYEFPHKLIDFKNDLTEEYLQKKLELEKQIFVSMSSAKQEDLCGLRRQKYRVEYLQNLLRRCK